MDISLFSVADHYPGGSRQPRDLYAQVLAEIELAERLGYRTYFTAEHHFHEYGLVPSPAALLGAASARTSRIRLGVAIAPLPMHDPLRLAEEYALLDQLSGGRLELGVGSGYLAHEFQGFNLGPWEKRARFDEALEVMLTAWRGEPFTHHGLYHHVEDTRIAVTPLQDPHPPISVGVLRPEAAYHVGRQGRSVMLIPYATCDTHQDLVDVIAEHRKGAEEAGCAPGDAEVSVALHSHVAETMDAARGAEDAFERYVGSRLYARKRSWEELEAEGLSIFGDAEHLQARAEALAELGVDHLMLLMNFGALEPERVNASMELVAQVLIGSAVAEPRLVPLS